MGGDDLLINQKNPHGGDIYTHRVRLDFSANLNPYGMPHSVKQALRDAAEVGSVYPDPYCRALTQRIAAYEGVDPSVVLCAAGAAELIYSFSYALQGQSKPALVIEPTFCEYSAALCAAGIPVQRYYLREEDGFRLTKDILKTDFCALSAVFLCAPNNPTGLMADKELVHAIAASGVRLMLDVSFLEFTQAPRYYDIASLLRQYPNVCVLRSMTKTFAIAGVRLGYALCSDTAFLQAMAQKAPCWNVSTPAQLAGIAALDEQAWLRESAAGILREKEKMMCTLEALGMRVYPSEANFLFFYSPRPLFETLLKKGILVRDCANYPGLREGYVRIAIRSEEENRKFAEAMREALL